MSEQPEGARVQAELRRLNQQLAQKVVQLRNLFDIGRELSASFDEEGIAGKVTTALMGQLLVSRAALYLRTAEGLRLLHERGAHGHEAATRIEGSDADAFLAALTRPRLVAELPSGPLRDRLERSRMSDVVPLLGADGAKGLMAVGERASRDPLTPEELEFAEALGRQALTALETARLHRVAVEKQRQDRELQVAREIQRSLFPRRLPLVPGFQLAATSEPCYEVGGDHYDFIPLDEGRLAFAVADVSGKGTPASILMAAVHASLRALAGTAPAGDVVARMNRFLCASTRPSSYVTLFYGELDVAARRLRYVNAGHVPPFRLGARGRQRLLVGGPALGILEDAEFESQQLPLEPGDVLAVVTDGATEAASPEDVEFGDERVFDVLEARSARSATETLAELLKAVRAWSSTAGCTDDLTALVLAVER